MKPFFHSEIMKFYFFLNWGPQSLVHFRTWEQQYVIVCTYLANVFGSAERGSSQLEGGMGQWLKEGGGGRGFLSWTHQSLFVVEVEASLLFSSSLAFHFARAPVQSPHEFALKGQGWRERSLTDWVSSVARRQSLIPSKERKGSNFQRSHSPSSLKG